MRHAHYMRFTAGNHGRLDRLGGLPGHLPPSWPIYPETGKKRAFLAQFYCFPGRLEIEGALCLHLYQDPDEDEPPFLVVVPVYSPENKSGDGVANAKIKPFDVEWDYKEDPDTATDDDVDLADSKAGGTCYFLNVVGEGESLVLQLRQQPAGFNFGGYSAVIVRTTEGGLEVRLG